MKGLKVKEILRKNDFTISGVAERLGESNQNLFAQLSKDDIKTGLLERISKATGIPVSLFFEESPIIDMDIHKKAISQISEVSRNDSTIDLLQDEIKHLRSLNQQYLEIIKNLTAK